MKLFVSHLKLLVSWVETFFPTDETITYSTQFFYYFLSDLNYSKNPCIFAVISKKRLWQYK